MICRSRSLEINICWDKVADNWLTTYEIAKEYQKKFNNLSEISADFKFKNSKKFPIKIKATFGNDYIKISIIKIKNPKN